MYLRTGDTTIATSTVTQAIMMSRGIDMFVSVSDEFLVGTCVSLCILLRGIPLHAQLEFDTRPQGIERSEDGKTIPILFTDAAGGTSVDNIILDQSVLQVDGDKIAVTVVLFETGDGFVHEFGFEDDDADLVTDPFTYLTSFGSEGNTNGIPDGNEVLR